MKINRLYNTLLFAFFVSFFSLAQNKPQDSMPSAKILSRVQENQILLRWAVTNAVAWEKTNANGFILEKYLFSKDGKRLPAPQSLLTLRNNKMIEMYNL